MKPNVVCLSNWQSIITRHSHNEITEAKNRDLTVQQFIDNVLHRLQYLIGELYDPTVVENHQLVECNQTCYRYQRQAQLSGERMMTLPKNMNVVFTKKM